jgi:F-box-like
MNIEEFPDELVLGIFAYVDLFTLVCARRVNKRFKAVIDDECFWRHRFTREFGSESAHEELTSSCWRQCVVHERARWLHTSEYDSDDWIVQLVNESARNSLRKRRALCPPRLCNVRALVGQPEQLLLGRSDTKLRLLLVGDDRQLLTQLMVTFSPGNFYDDLSRLRHLQRRSVEHCADEFPPAALEFSVLRLRHGDSAVCIELFHAARGMPPKQLPEYFARVHGVVIAVDAARHDALEQAKRWLDYVERCLHPRASRLLHVRAPPAPATRASNAAVRRLHRAAADTSALFDKTSIQGAALRLHIDALRQATTLHCVLCAT